MYFPVSIFVVIISVASSSPRVNMERIIGTQDAMRASKDKAGRLLELVSEIKSLQKIPSYLTPEPWIRRNHTVVGPAVFAAAFAVGSKQKDAARFCRTLMKSGFNGDIVLATLPNPDRTFIDELKKMPNIIIYVVPLVCRQYRGVWCHLPDEPGYTQISVKTIRFRLYEWWASFYKPTAMLMLSDFRDVFFQANPFTYHPEDWHPPRFQLVVFQEAFFNIIGRCPFHVRWFTDCYGIETLRRFQTLPIICSGVTIGTRDAIIAYAYSINQQLRQNYRIGPNSTGANHKRCLKGEVDQVFHDFLIYEKVLEPFMDVKIFSQGEGPVNTLGAFYFHHDKNSSDKRIQHHQNVSAKVELPLKLWRILKPPANASFVNITKPAKYSVYNWNNEKSPCVHQLDRFLLTELQGGYEQHLDVFGP